MKSLKHIGRLKNSGTKVLIAFRTLPGESDQALVVLVTSLSDSYHDAIMQLVESEQAQDAFEFGEIMHIRPFPDGRPMLLALREDQKLLKTPTDNVIVTPNTVDTVLLSELNVAIAQQKNCAVDDLCTFVSGAPKPAPATEVEEIAQVKDLGKDLGEPTIPAEPKVAPLMASQNTALSDSDIAKSYRSQADAMYKEAARLRKEADQLDPPKPKATKAKATASA